ncbi:hypothetical protein GFB56_31125 [Ensifer sp. T173]|uniref:Secreted protein n=1 Tax=Ensifer canadensis TaxID=555315 RepID=A0AAW4FV38_9HYPH|nr:hypothetical protein [Ensifer canadensis]NOV18287.1 hypothetical protein [Ensifer canadensis]
MSLVAHPGLASPLPFVRLLLLLEGGPDDAPEHFCAGFRRDDRRLWTACANVPGTETRCSSEPRRPGVISCLLHVSLNRIRFKETCSNSECYSDICACNKDARRCSPGIPLR